MHTLWGDSILLWIAIFAFCLGFIVNGVARRKTGYMIPILLVIAAIIITVSQRVGTIGIW